MNYPTVLRKLAVISLCKMVHHATLLNQYEWFAVCGVTYMQDWPGNSPVFKPIENLWPIIKATFRNVLRPWDITQSTKGEEYLFYLVY